MRANKTVLVPALLLASASVAQATDFSFVDRNANGLWADTTNWDKWDGSGNVPAGTLPGSADHAILEGSDVATINSNVGTIGQLELERYGGTQTVLTITSGGELTVASGPVHTSGGLGSVSYLNVTGGTLNVIGSDPNVRLGINGTGYLNVTDGLLHINGNLELQAGWGTGAGYVDLAGGTMEVGFLLIRTGNFNIAGGTLVLVGNQTLDVENYINNGAMTAYDGTGTLDVFYNAENNTTVVTAAAVPEVASLSLLVTGGITLLRRRR